MQSGCFSPRPQAPVEDLFSTGMKRLNALMPEPDLPPLIEASKSGRLSELIGLLREAGPLDVRDVDGRTALIWAAKRGRPEHVRLLISAGAEVNAEDRFRVNAINYASLTLVRSRKLGWGNPAREAQYKKVVSVLMNNKANPLNACVGPHPESPPEAEYRRDFAAGD